MKLSREQDILVAKIGDRVIELLQAKNPELLKELMQLPKAQANEIMGDVLMAIWLQKHPEKRN